MIFHDPATVCATLQHASFCLVHPPHLGKTHTCIEVERRSSGCWWQPIVSLLTTWEPFSKRGIPKVIAKQSRYSVLGCWLEEHKDNGTFKVDSRLLNCYYKKCWRQSLQITTPGKFLNEHSQLFRQSYWWFPAERHMYVILLAEILHDTNHTRPPVT